MPRIATVLLIPVAVTVMLAESGASTPSSLAACPVASMVVPLRDRPTYKLQLRVQDNLTEVSGALTVSFAPSVATDRLVLRLWPNSPAFAGNAHLAVGAVRSNGRRLASSQPDPTTLVVRRELKAGERVTFSMGWKLRLARRAGLALRGGRSARLVSFFPLLAWDGSGWATDPPLHTLDSVWPTSPTADFTVRVHAPRGLRVLASGDEFGPGRWRARAVRDFALAIGSFDVVRTVVRAPAPVRVTVGLERSSLAPIQAFVAETRRSLRFYGERYGAYPWPSYTLAVMSDFPSLAGFAYPTLGFVGDSSAVLVPHETAHQWFQSLVGNNQSQDPWLSEGLATWAQTGPEKSLGAMLATFIPADIRNRIGEPVSFFDRRGFEKLRLGVYVQSVQALASLGDVEAVDCALRSFVAASAYRTTEPRDLLATLEHFFPDARQKLEARGARF